MALTNSQYDSIMREYDRRQYENYRQQCARIDEIYEKIPRIREIQETMSSCSVRQAEKLMDEEPDALETLRQELTRLRQERDLLLKNAGYPVDYMEMHYTCPDCKDTGYIDRKKCHCFRQKEIQLLYSSSRMEKVLQKENFSSLSYDVYDEEQQKAMPSIIRTCQNFA